MKKILVPTDFSSVADNALNYAIEIAAKFESELLLYHIYTFNRKVDYNWDFPEDEQPYVKRIERQMAYRKESVLEKINQNGIVIQTVVEEGDIFSLFKTEVKKHDIDLIVMGSKGASGLEKVIFGSVAADALELARVPVLIVPPNYSFFPPERILLPTDLNEVSSNILAPLQKMASIFDAKITVLNVKTGSGNSAAQNADFYLKDIETTYCEVPVSKSINESINGFIKRNTFDLMCMIRRKKGFFESIFKESITKNQVYNSKIPLLVLPEPA